MVQVRQTFADGEEHLVGIHLALEQVLQDIDRRRATDAVTGRTGGLGGIQALDMMVGQVVQSFQQPPERPVMRRQDQSIGGQVPEPLEAVQEPRQGIGLRFLRPDGHVGADLGQDLVAGNQHAQVRTVQAGMFG